ncbi:serine hydrolase [Patescibacteria group bacterium]|nr:serine hydrolase [Patescibacteria group bacterium]
MKKTKKHLFGILLSIAFLILPGVTVQAQYSSVRTFIDADTIVRGYTVKGYGDTVFVGIRPNVFRNESTVKIEQVSSDDTPEIPSGLEKASDVYTYNIAMSVPHVLDKPIMVALSYAGNDSYGKSIYFFDRNDNKWKPIPTTFDTNKKHARALIHFPYTTIAVLKDTQAQSGEPYKKGSQALGIEAYAGAVIDASSGTVLYEKNGSVPITMASLTKLMTAKIALESGINLDGETYISSGHMAEGARMSINPGDKVRNRDLFFGTLVPSGNNAAKALASATGLSHSDFVERMNNKADSLGLSTMHFDGVTGLEPGNKTSAIDYALLSRDVLKNKTMLEGTTTKNYCFSPVNRSNLHCFKNTNKLLDSELYVTGGKTGYLPGYAGGAGASLMVKAKNKDGHEVIAVVLAHPSYSRQFGDVHKMINWAFVNYSF